MNNIVFQYSQESALSAGESAYINESGAFTGKITAAKWTTTQNGAKGLELSFESQDGRKANYITVYHTKTDGTPNTYGQAHINAVMGILSLPQLTAAWSSDSYICPELIGKPIGLILQKVLTTKQDGSDSYKFELVLAFHAQRRQTLKEMVEQAPAERVDKIAATLKDKDERHSAPSNSGSHVPPPPQRQAQQAARRPQEDIDDDIPL